MLRCASFLLAAALGLGASGAQAQGHGGAGGGHGGGMEHARMGHDHDHDHDHHHFIHNRFFFGGGAYFDGFYPYAYDAYYYPYFYPPLLVYAPPPTDVAVSATPIAGRANCREFQTTVLAEGQPQPLAGTVCQQPDGSWRVAR